LSSQAGLSTNESVSRALRDGAAAAMLGTRYVATVEANAHPDYKRALVAAKSADTAFTNCFDIDWPYSMVRVETARSTTTSRPRST
jgi:NAD(P)H-dependent flavin oxidoreductase YrpB (nitropropane dioxygenase family)